ncbi:Gfo/Idh/MocA family protein [Sphaerisporangium perillae]|uniref:Gfo/Idh/MocA family protein n=1 Tax=Sphaerisporangium perillae TaxID=2935860 RepID=UPI00201004AA|nr:Gfo/Idh/MocA family oxidoreductase [Sphaerisporangium perillae]
MAIAIGLTGAGHRAAKVHAPAIAACGGAYFAGIWARSPDATRVLAARYDVPVFGRFDELLDHCDAVVFAVPPPVQPELAEVAARRGKALLLERPVAGDLAGAERLAEAAEGTVSQLALTWRYSPVIRRFLSGAVPKTWPKGASGRVLAAAPPDPRPWRRGLSVLRGDLGPDLLDLLDAALGRVVGVHAHGEPTGWFGMMFEHEGGTYSEISMYASPEPVRQRAEIEVFGPGGVADIDGVAATAGRGAVDTMYREFTDAAEQRRRHELDAVRGLHLQEVIEATESDLLHRVAPP